MQLLLTSLIAFVSTNIDDLFILTLFYGNRQFRHGEILTGQLLGIGTLIVVSLIGSLIGVFVPQAYIGLLGFIPMFLGVRGIWRLYRGDGESDNDERPRTTGDKSKILTVAGVTIANGGDNIGIYVPLFATFNWSGKATMIVMFLLMTVVWCLTARWFVKHPYVARTVDRYGHIITPFVLVLLGVYILYENGTFGLL
jgi:cadmium resistance transport/sequestration family protein